MPKLFQPGGQQSSTLETRCLLFFVCLEGGSVGGIFLFCMFVFPGMGVGRVAVFGVYDFFC